MHNPTPLHFERTVDDIVDFSMTTWRHSPRYRVTSWLVGGVLALTVPLTAGVVWAAGDGGWLVAAALGLAVALSVPMVLGTWWVVMKLHASLNAQRARALVLRGASAVLVGPISVHADAEALRVTSPVADTRYAWRAVSRLVRTSQHLGLYVTPVAAVIIPRRAFATADSESAFCALVERLAGRVFADLPPRS